MYSMILQYKDFIAAQKKAIADNEAEIVRQKELIKAIPTQDLPPFKNRVKKFKGIFPNFKGLLDAWNRRQHAGSVLIVNFEMINGKHRSFQVREKKGIFRFKGGDYVLDNDAKYYNIDAEMFMLDYHEGCSMPIKRVFPIKDIKEAVGVSPSQEIEHAVNPRNLKEALDAKLVEGIIQGAGLAKEFRMLLIITVITMIVSIVMVLLFAWKTGMLKEIGSSLPF